MPEAETSSTKLLCPNGHGLQPAKRDGIGWVLSCACTRGNALSPQAKTGVQTPVALQTTVKQKPALVEDPIEDPTVLDTPISPFNPEVEYEERAPQEQEVGSGYVRPTAREAGDYAAFVGKTN